MSIRLAFLSFIALAACSHGDFRQSGSDDSPHEPISVVEQGLNQADLTPQDLASLQEIDLAAIDPLELQRFLSRLLPDEHDKQGSNNLVLRQVRLGALSETRMSTDAQHLRLWAAITHDNTPPLFLAAMKSIEQKRAFARLIHFFLTHSTDRSTNPTAMLTSCLCMGRHNIAQQFVDIVIQTTKRFNAHLVLDYVGFATGFLLPDYTIVSALMALGYQFRTFSFIDPIYKRHKKFNESLLGRFNQLLVKDHPREVSVLPRIRLYNNVSAYTKAAPAIATQVLLTCTDPGDTPEVNKADRDFIAVRKRLLLADGTTVISSALWWHIGKWWDGDPAKPVDRDLLDIALEAFEGSSSVYRRINTFGPFQ